MRKVQILKINKLTLVHVSCIDWALVNSCPGPDTFFFLNDLVFGKCHVCSFAFAMRSVKHAYYFNPISGLYFDRYEIFLKGHRLKMSAPLPLEFKKEKLKKHVNVSTFPFVSRVMGIDCLMGDFINLWASSLINAYDVGNKVIFNESYGQNITQNLEC